MRSRRPSGVHTWLILWKAFRTVEACAQRSIQQLGMCASDFAVLEVLLHKGPLPVNQLGKKVLLTSGSMTAAADRLEQRGLVERRGDPGDRRARIVHLTDAGKRLITGIFATHERDMERAVSVLEDDELEAMVAALRKLGRGAGQYLERSGE